MIKRILFLSLVYATAVLGANAQAPPDGPQGLKLGVVMYDGYEPLDVFGPVEMFFNLPPNFMRVYMVTEDGEPVGAMSTGNNPGPRVMADYSFENAPQFDILLVPGGIGTLKELTNEAMLEFIRTQSEKARMTTSVCTGSAILAKAGVLDGKEATTNKVFFNIAVAQGPETDWKGRARWVKDGEFVTSSGVSAGIDMALAVIAELYGEEAAQGIADATEYVWNRDPDNDPFAVEDTD